MEVVEAAFPIDQCDQKVLDQKVFQYMPSFGPHNDGWLGSPEHGIYVPGGWLG